MVKKIDKIQPPKQDFFSKKGYLSRGELSGKFREASFGYDMGLDRIKREKMLKEVFGKETGYYVNRSEFQKAIKKLQHQSFIAKTGKEKLEFERKARFLKKIANL